ncbi:MAG: UvrD-helicase domain-containing protein, partial [Candidatus Omnitrophica bacterium]|nr:UvrD-helicase domain-containing protein [Candidatus Omnitrophota bacterium]
MEPLDPGRERPVADHECQDRLRRQRITEDLSGVSVHVSRAQSVEPATTTAHPSALGHSTELLLDDLTSAQREAVLHEGGPLLIIAGAGTGKTTVITRRIAWLISTKRVRPEELLALTFTDKAAKEMEERVDLLLPYGYLDVSLRTFHAFGDQLAREHALKLGLSPRFRVLSQAEQAVFLRQHVFELPLQEFRPLTDPTRFLEALATLMARAKDEAVEPEEFMAYARELQRQAAESPQEPLRAHARRALELAQTYVAYQQLLRQNDLVDFGDQVLLAIRVLE